MAGTLFWIDAIQVFIGTDDHPPPHVHAVHSGEGWTGGDGFRAKVALKPGKAAVGILSARYDPVSCKVALGLDDGSRLSLTAGQHIEEAEEW